MVERERPWGKDKQINVGEGVREIGLYYFIGK